MTNEPDDLETFRCVCCKEWRREEDVLEVYGDWVCRGECFKEVSANWTYRQAREYALEYDGD